MSWCIKWRAEDNHEWEEIERWDPLEILPGEPTEWFVKRKCPRCEREELVVEQERANAN